MPALFRPTRFLNVSSCVPTVGHSHTNNASKVLLSARPAEKGGASSCKPLDEQKFNSEALFVIDDSRSGRVRLTVPDPLNGATRAVNPEKTHELTGVGEISTFFEVCVPSYASSRSRCRERECTYFRFVADDDRALEEGDAEVGRSPHGQWIVDEEPTDFWVGDSPYFGVRFRR